MQGLLNLLAHNLVAFVVVRTHQASFRHPHVRTKICARLQAVYVIAIGWEAPQPPIPPCGTAKGVLTATHGLWWLSQGSYLVVCY